MLRQWYTATMPSLPGLLHKQIHPAGTQHLQAQHFAFTALRLTLSWFSCTKLWRKECEVGYIQSAKCECNPCFMYGEGDSANLSVASDFATTFCTDTRSDVHLLRGSASNARCCVSDGKEGNETRSGGQLSFAVALLQTYVLRHRQSALRLSLLLESCGQGFGCL